MVGSRIALSVALLFVTLPRAAAQKKPGKKPHDHAHAHFSIRSTSSGNWSNAKTWKPARIPKQGDRVLISRGTTVKYDVKSKSVIRLVQVVGTLSFARTIDTEMNVGLLIVPHSEKCSEHGFACEFEGASDGPKTKNGQWPTLLVGTPESPISPKVRARIRLHFLKGMNKNDAPAIACCSGRMEIHGSPLSHTWVKLGKNCKAGDKDVMLANAVQGWRVGDEVIVTGSKRSSGFGSFRPGARRTMQAQTERRRITKIIKDKLTLDKPLTFEHFGEGEFKSEVANLSRNVIIESADPKGVRGHTVYHRFSKGGISYARFAHLGKEGVLGRYAIHYHLVGDTMRGSQLKGVAIVDSHNRWITIHGTQYLVVRDCVGYQSVGHGFFMEDGTEVFNLLDGNLGVHAYRARRLPKQVLPFDQNDGAAFWWANGLNTLTRNIGVESDRYGFRYDMQHSRRFSSKLPIRQADGKDRVVDVRKLPIWRFEDNEAHGSFAGMVVAANGGRQPDVPIHNQRTLKRIRSIDWTGPDRKHPHMIRNFKIWHAHYAFRPHSPNMRMENVRIHRAAYGIYRPAFENHEYTNLHISAVGAEPFNRGMDDASAQTGSISVDGLTFETGYGNRSTPLVQISDNNLSGDAETHFRKVKVKRPPRFRDRWPLINRGVGPRITPITKGVPYFIHDYFGKGRHAKVVSSAAKDLLADGNKYTKDPPLTGDQSRVAEVKNVRWPKLLEPVDDLPPATIVTSVVEARTIYRISGVSHDNGKIVSVTVNGKVAKISSLRAGVADWGISISKSSVKGKIIALAKDAAGNIEKTGHVIQLGKKR